MEQLDLTTPLTYPSTTNWKVVKLALDWYGQFIEIGLLGSNGERKAHSYSGSDTPEPIEYSESLYHQFAEAGAKSACV